MLRTHTCGELSENEVGKEVTLCGWIDAIRPHGKVSFVDIRDRYGITQIFIGKELNEILLKLKRESVIRATGKVKKKPQPNPKLKTGKIEVEVKELEILNLGESPLPLNIDEGVESTEETRLRYRYLDLRRPKMRNNIITRYKIIKAMRDFLDKEDFIEIETPILAKSTPEGARDYLVPSRLYKGKFFALPQSPQMFKQLCMVAGFDKYFQIARCLRDEDLRADRQPEFTQLDLEMSFVEEKDILDIIEKIIKYVFKKVLNKELEIPFPRISYETAIKKYKSDKPNLSKSKDDFKFLWVTDFPLFKYSEEEKRIVSEHHPFTGVKESDMKLLEKDPLKATSRSYDLVLNGYEIGSGSIRIHDKNLQKQIFKALKISEKEAEEKFGFLMNALRFGPPHGGIALGLDRIIAIITGNESIREVIAFPKNKEAKDLMLDAPSEVSKQQLKEIGFTDHN